MQELVDPVAATEQINPPLFDIAQRKTRAAASAFPCFYDSSWLTDANKFLGAVACFKEVIANSKIIDSFFQQCITSAVTSAVAMAVAAIQCKHDNQILSMQEMIEKSLLLRESLSTTALSDPDAIPKAHPGNHSLPKIITKR